MLAEKRRHREGKGITGQDKTLVATATGQELVLSSPSSVRPAVPATPGFESWWAAWWNKNAKADARKAWVAAERKYGAQFLIDQVAADRARFEGTDSWSWRANLHPATWLRGARWEDQLPPTVARPGRRPDMVAQVSDSIESSLRKGESPW